MSRLLSVSFALLVMVGCGDDTASDGGLDLSAMADLRGQKPPVDLYGDDFAGIGCGGSMICSAGNICCVTPSPDGMTITNSCEPMGSCGDGGIPAACDGPEDCTGSNCCIGLSLGSGGQIAGSAACNASCNASIMIGTGGNSGTLTTKLCHGAADCTSYTGPTPFGDQAYSACCNYAGIPVGFCAPSLITSVVMGITCM
jgi:hypothetical protein